MEEIIPKFIVVFVIGLTIGALAVIFYNDYYEENTGYRTPDEIADIIEGMIFNGTNLEEIPQGYVRALVEHPDKTTLTTMKNLYLGYGDLSRNMLKFQINNLCFKKEFKPKCPKK